MASATKSSRESLPPPPSSVLRLEPPNAYFPPPHNTRSIRNTLTLTNVSDASYVFKVRGLRGEAYQVKPTIFVIPPTSAVRVQLTLKKTDMVLSDATTKDRFRISCKKLQDPAVAQGAAPDYRAIWGAHENEQSAAELDVKCHFGADVPRGVWITFLADDQSAAEVASAAPTTAMTQPPPAQGGVPPLAPAAAAAAATPTTTKAPNAPSSAKVKFGTQEGGGARATAAAGSPTPEDPNASKNAAANARRLRETVQQEIELLKKQAAALEAVVASEKQQENRIVNEALDLEEQRRRVQDGTARNAAQRAALDDQKRSSAAHSAAAGGTLPAAPGPLQSPPAADSNNKAVASSPKLHTAVSKPKKGGLFGSMYLSTVLIWMIIVYLLGLVYRAYLIQQGHDAASVDLLQYLPSDIREMIMPLRGYLF